jgi:hypothetical protein
VLIADDNAFVRGALYEFFEGEPDFQVCAVAENGSVLIDKARVSSIEEPLETCTCVGVSHHEWDFSHRSR